MSQAEKYQSRFAVSIFTGYEAVMILPVNHNRFISIKSKK
jgi:hypothetical protein